MPPPGQNKVRHSFADASDSGGLIRPARKRAKKHPAPYSIRFDDEERARLNKDAKGKSWAAYIRSVLFPDVDQPQQRQTRKTRQPAINQQLAAQILGLLGQSRLSSNLNQIAKGANRGTLPVTPELKEELRQACADICEMRRALILVLGIKEQ